MQCLEEKRSRWRLALPWKNGNFEEPGKDIKFIPSSTKKRRSIETLPGLKSSEDCRVFRKGSDFLTVLDNELRNYWVALTGSSLDPMGMISSWLTLKLFFRGVKPLNDLLQPILQSRSRFLFCLFSWKWLLTGTQLGRNAFPASISLPMLSSRDCSCNGEISLKRYFSWPRFCGERVETRLFLQRWDYDDLSSAAGNYEPEK